MRTALIAASFLVVCSCAYAQERGPARNITLEEMKTMRTKIQHAERNKLWPNENVRAVVLLCLSAPEMPHCETWRR